MSRFAQVKRRGAGAFIGLSGVLAATIAVPPATAAPFAFVTNGNGNTVSVVDVATNRIISTVSGLNIPVSIALTPNGALAYVGNYGNSTVSVIDTAKAISDPGHAIVTTISGLAFPYGLAISPDGSTALVTNANFYATLSVSRIPTTSNTIQCQYYVPAPFGVAFDPGGSYAYVSQPYSNQVAVVAAGASNCSGLPPAPVNTNAAPAYGSPTAIAMSKDGAYAVTANQSTQSVSIFDGNLLRTYPPAAFLGVLSVPFLPDGVAITPSNTAYIAGSNTNTVAVIDLAAHALTGSIPVGHSPGGIASTPDGALVYVANNGDNTVSVISTATNTVLTTVTGLVGPTAVAVTPIQPPIANAGTSSTANLGTLVTLNGSGSSDPNGLSLTYAWSFRSKPAASSAVLSNANTVTPSFTPDAVGDYVVQLVVTNSAGLSSQPATVTISTLNPPPVADAGPDQAITVIGTLVTLDGSHSYDPDGEQIAYQWTITVKPAGSNAVLSQPTSAKPTFIADVHGSYTIQLIVADAGGASKPDTVQVSFANVAPVANAGLSQSTVVGQTVTLNGTGSSDANGDTLSYSWSLSSVPTGSHAAIANPTAPITTFVPDLPGPYVAQLIVNDGFVNSAPATVQIQAVTAQTKAIADTQRLQQIVSAIPAVQFKNATMQNALLNMLNSVIAEIAAGDYADALGQLQNDILGKTDGCAKSAAPDKNDWILDCTDQSGAYQQILQIIAELKAL